MANLNFKKDLVLGNIGENVIIEFLISNGLTYLESNDDNRYDFIMLKDNVKTTYEVKTDVLCRPTYDTGNMFVEFKCRGKASGIETSKAKWFVTYFKYLNEIWFITTKMEETHGYLIKRNKFKIILKLLIYLNNQ
jgi:hypothetical protein